MTQLHKVTILVIDNCGMGMSEIKDDLESPDGCYSTYVIDSVPVDPWQMPHDVAFDDEHIKAILDRCRNPGKQQSGDEKCGTCWFWYAGEGGFCRWKPNSSAKGRSEWCSAKDSSDWCREYKAEETEMTDQPMDYFTLLDVLERGGCIAYDHGNERWVWVWHGQMYATRHTCWRRFGWGSKVGTAEDVIWLMRHHADSWVIVHDPPVQKNQ